MNLSLERLISMLFETYRVMTKLVFLYNTDLLSWQKLS